MGSRNIKQLPPDLPIRSTMRPRRHRLRDLPARDVVRQEYGWDHTFEAYVAGPLADFAKAHNDRERIWIIEKDGRVVGSIAIVEASKDEAQLPCFLVHPALRPRGIGRFLMDEAISFCRDSHYSGVSCGLRALGSVGQTISIRRISND